MWGVLCLGTILLDLLGADFYIQDLFYNATTKTWLINGADPFLKMIFYKGIKYVIASFGLVLLGSVICRWVKNASFQMRDKKMLVVIFSLILIPTIIALSKEFTYIHCPSRLRFYGGGSDFQNFLHLFSPLNPLDRGKCFPAGHASGGFALMSVYVFGRTSFEKWMGVGIGFFLGWVMAFYQMAKGAHFLSHSCMTMILSWAMIVGLSHLFLVRKNS